MSKAPYNNKRVYRKTIISKDEYDKVIEEASVAGIILNEDRFDFVRQILLSAKEYAATSIIENTIMDASKEVTISNVVKKIFTQKKEVQVDELSGQYKLVKKFFDELQGYIDTRDAMIAQIEAETASIDDE